MEYERISARLPSKTWSQLKSLQKMWNLKTLSEALERCIKENYKNREV